MMAFNGLTPLPFQAQWDPRRCSRLSFQQTPKKRPRGKEKTPVIQGELQLALSVQPLKCGT